MVSGTKGNPPPGNPTSRSIWRFHALISRAGFAAQREGQIKPLTTRVDKILCMFKNTMLIERSTTVERITTAVKQTLPIVDLWSFPFYAK